MDKEEIQTHYKKHQREIENRLQEFNELRNSSNQRWFQELSFVILTSQADAEKCWEAINKLEELSLLEEGSKEEISEILEQYNINYERDKSKYIVENRSKLSQPTLKNPSKDLKLKSKVDPENLDSTREWLAENIKGISWKGASHFLRNIGYGNSFAIISSHIIQKLHQLEIIENLENPSSKEEYLEIEQKMKNFSKDIEIDIKALDLVLWSMKTQKVFK